MNCMESLVKYILYIFNLIFVICGILLIILGSLMLSNMGGLKSFSNIANTNTVPVLILVLGCIIFVVSFFGCCGAIRENTCCLTIYSILMFIIFVLTLTMVVWFFVKRQDFLNTMSDAVDEAWKHNDDANGYPMDSLQVGFTCCGVNNYRDYLSINKPVPNSCCGSLSQLRDSSCTPAIYEARKGCRAAFVDFWASNTNIIRYAGIGVALVELVAFTIGCCLASSVRKSHGHNF